MNNLRQIQDLNERNITNKKVLILLTLAEAKIKITVYKP